MEKRRWKIGVLWIITGYVARNGVRVFVWISDLFVNVPGLFFYWVSSSFVYIPGFFFFYIPNVSGFRVRLLTFQMYLHSEWRAHSWFICSCLFYIRDKRATLCEQIITRKCPLYRRLNFSKPLFDHHLRIFPRPLSPLQRAAAIHRNRRSERKPRKNQP